MLEHKIQSIWYGKSPIRFLLWPFSVVFGMILFLRKFLYRIGLKKTVTFNCPVIIVGNITVGGTGKTPLVIALANFLQSQGYAPGIISRGYKGTNQLPQLVNEKSDPAVVGDEAVLLAKRAHCPLVISKDRIAAMERLLKETGCNVVLSDDGLQHLALGRSIEIAVINAHAGFGNGFLLPAGPLRESKTRLKTVDFCVVNGGEAIQKNHAAHQFAMSLQLEGCVNLKDGTRFEDLSQLSSKTLHAVAGIGFPDQFFRALKALGLIFTPHAFSDHYPFKKQDFNFLKADEWVVMTEKDAVKCQTFADERYWYIPISAKLPTAFFSSIIGRVNNWFIYYKKDMIS